MSELKFSQLSKSAIRIETNQSSKISFKPEVNPLTPKKALNTSQIHRSSGSIKTLSQIKNPNKLESGQIRPMVTKWDQSVTVVMICSHMVGSCEQYCFPLEILITYKSIFPSNKIMLKATFRTVLLLKYTDNSMNVSMDDLRTYLKEQGSYNEEVLKNFCEQFESLIEELINENEDEESVLNQFVMT